MLDPVGAELNRHSRLADIDFVKELSAEDQRGVAEQLTEEELALFDILTKPEFDITDNEKAEVKKVARMLRNAQGGQAGPGLAKETANPPDVYTTVKTVLDELPRAYTPELYQQKCDTVYQHVYDSYAGEGSSIYATASRSTIKSPAKLPDAKGHQ